MTQEPIEGPFIPPVKEDKEMSRRAGRRIAFFLFGFSLLVAFDASTHADEAGNLILRKTYLKTQNGTSTVLGVFADAFTPTTVSCPDDIGDCTIRVEVSSLFEQLEPGSVAVMRVRVGGIGAAPTSTVEVDSMSSGTLGNVRTFTWIRTGVAPGSHIVDVDFAMSGYGAPAIAGPRTLTIEVYKWPFYILPLQ